MKLFLAAPLSQKTLQDLIELFDPNVNQFDYKELPFGGPTTCVRVAGAKACHKDDHLGGLFISNRNPKVMYRTDLANDALRTAWDERFIVGPVNKPGNPLGVALGPIANVSKAVKPVLEFFSTLLAVYGGGSGSTGARPTGQ